MPKGNGKPIPKVELPSKLTKDSREELLETLAERFQANKARHKGLDWSKIQAKLEKSSQKLEALNSMEATGGEPDVIGYDKKADEYIFCDCSEQSPNRRSICYDGEGEAMRKKKDINPGGNAVDLAKEMGVELLDEEEYRQLQEVGEFDTTTSSWLKTPKDIRKLGGAIFGDRRYDTVFKYHNGAESFYSARGFRGLLRV